MAAKLEEVTSGLSLIFHWHVTEQKKRMSSVGVDYHYLSDHHYDLSVEDNSEAQEGCIKAAETATTGLVEGICAKARHYTPSQIRDELKRVEEPLLQEILEEIAGNHLIDKVISTGKKEPRLHYEAEMSSGYHNFYAGLLMLKYPQLDNDTVALGMAQTTHPFDLLNPQRILNGQHSGEHHGVRIATLVRRSAEPDPKVL